MALQTEHSRNLAALAIAAAAAVAAVLFNFTTPARYVENLTYDLRMALAAPPPGEQLVIVKMDDRAVDEMRSQSACGCISPIDKDWLADVITALDDHGAKVVLVDYLFDTWRSKEEYASVAQKLGSLRTPVIVGAAPDRVPGKDFDVLPGIRYADARALVKDDYDDVVRSYDPLPGNRRSLAAATVEAVGGKVEPGVFRLRYRAPHPGANAENAGSLAPAFSAGDVAFLPAKFFVGKTVLIGRVSRSAGVDAETLGEDLHTTPLRYLPGHYDGTPGVEVHAHAVLQMLQKDRIIIPGLPWLGLIALIAALGGAALGRSAFSWLRALRWLVGLVVVGAAGGLPEVAEFFFGGEIHGETPVGWGAAARRSVALIFAPVPARRGNPPPRPPLNQAAAARRTIRRRRAADTSSVRPVTLRVVAVVVAGGRPASMILPGRPLGARGPAPIDCGCGAVGGDRSTTPCTTPIHRTSAGRSPRPRCSSHSTVGRSCFGTASRGAAKPLRPPRRPTRRECPRRSPTGRFSAGRSRSCTWWTTAVRTARRSGCGPNVS